jgi:hypothetical protein
MAQPFFKQEANIACKGNIGPLFFGVCYQISYSGTMKRIRIIQDEETLAEEGSIGFPAGNPWYKGDLLGGMRLTRM